MRYFGVIVRADRIHNRNVCEALAATNDKTQVLRADSSYQPTDVTDLG